MTKVIYDEDYINDDDLRPHLVGHSITHIDEDNCKLTLDNGRTFTFFGDSNIDSWIELELIAGERTTNIITDVVEQENSDQGFEKKWDINILAEHTLLAKLAVHEVFYDGYFVSIGLTITEED